MLSLGAWKTELVCSGKFLRHPCWSVSLVLLLWLLLRCVVHDGSMFGKCVNWVVVCWCYFRIDIRSKQASWTITFEKQVLDNSAHERVFQFKPFITYEINVCCLFSFLHDFQRAVSETMSFLIVSFRETSGFRMTKRWLWPYTYSQIENPSVLAGPNLFCGADVKHT